MASRWFVVPIAGDGTRDSGYRPAYSDDSRITGYSGNIYDVPADAGLPFSGPHYAVHFHADVDEDLVDLANEHSDAYAEGVDATQGDIASWLNDHFGTTRSFAEWSASFTVGTTTSSDGPPDLPFDARPQPAEDADTTDADDA